MKVLAIAGCRRSSTWWPSPPDLILGGRSRHPVRDGRDLLRPSEQCATQSCQMEPFG